MDSKVARQFIKDTLISMYKNGASIIRLDVFAYDIKKSGTSYFFIEPEMWDLLYEIKDIVNEYYIGMLAGENDIELMESTKNGRDINHRYYSEEEIKENLENRKIVNDIRDLIKFRNTNPAFGLDGKCIEEVNGNEQS